MTFNDIHTNIIIRYHLGNYWVNNIKHFKKHMINDKLVFFNRV